MLTRKRQKPQNGLEEYKNLPEVEKQKVVEYRKKKLENMKNCVTISFSMEMKI